MGWDRWTISALAILTVLAGGPADAQQSQGTLGSPSATETIDGKYLPAPPPKFGGVINLGAEQSKPYWPPPWCRPRARPTCCSS
jgi:arylsulfatase